MAVPAWLVTELAGGSGRWLFPAPRGGPWRHATWKRIWRQHRKGGKLVEGAIERAGVPWLRVHDLRHTYASLAIGAGADVKVLQRSLGHASATLTLDLYGHLLDSALDDVASRMGDLGGTLRAHEGTGGGRKGLSGPGEGT